MRAIIQTLGNLLVEIIKYFIFPVIMWIIKFMARHVVVSIIIIVYILVGMAKELGNDNPMSYENVSATKQAVSDLRDTILDTETVKIISNIETVKGLKKDIGYVSEKVDGVAEHSNTYKGIKKDLKVK